MMMLVSSLSRTRSRYSDHERPRDRGSVMWQPAKRRDIECNAVVLLDAADVAERGED